MAKNGNGQHWQNRIVGSGEERPDQLLANPYNFRLHPQHQQDALAGVLNEVGWVQQVIVNKRTGNLIDGHLRVSLALRNHEPTIPVVYVDVSEEQEKLILATLDPISALAGTDAAKLDELLRDVQSGEAAVQAMLAELAAGAGLYQTPTPGNGGDDFDTTPLEGPTRTQSGDLWRMGEHRLIVGDSTDPATVARLMGGERAALVFTSPPYTDQREYKIGAFDWFALMRGVFDQIVTAVTDGGHILINLGLSHKERRVDMYWDSWLGYCESQGWPLFGWYAWDKGSGMPGDWSGRLAPAHEFVFHFNRETKQANKWIETEGRGPSHNYFRQKDGSLRAATSPDKIGQPFKVPDSVIRINRELTRGIHTQGHPAVYPVAFPEFGINTWSAHGDIVLDPFGGSGTTLIACERTGRKCRMVEIEPRYADVILRRYEAETGQAAELVERLEHVEH